MERLPSKGGYNMATVMIRCPSTGNEISTGMAMDQASFDSSDLTDNIVGGCPECGSRHTWSKKDAFLEVGASDG